MNYIVLNGVKSTTVKGLLIQSLPPITKPQMRTSIETIDGMDGDIVTKLGYSAYDKEVSIGLYGDYDIDDVIRYFSSEGDVTFSNEPDKYYRYQILEQIDYERLIRFRTAKVKMHVQPFKYDDVDRELIISNQLIDFPQFNKTANGITLTATGETIVLKGTATEATEFYMPILPITLNEGNYTLTANATGTAKGCSIRLISNSPTDSKSFGKSYISLVNNSAENLSGYDTGEFTYNYLWFYIPYQTVLNCTIKVTLKQNDFSRYFVLNRGNVQSKPKFTIYCEGKTTLTVNDINSLEINVDEDYITIDIEKMNAYHDGMLKNRQVTGDYAKMVLQTGGNTLTWSGNVSKIIIDDFSRWI